LAVVEFSNALNKWQLKMVPLVGDASPTVIHDFAAGYQPGQVDWSPDDEQLLFVDFDEKLQDGVLERMPASGDDLIVVDRTNAGIGGGAARWSQDGKQITYTRYNWDRQAADLMLYTVSDGSSRVLAPLGTGISAGYAQWVYLYPKD
jgi:hypothetical protein